ncbi:hypothetical protein BU25DRAFT_412024 [Macroventuria anomochaeta]|uniref:Uncharacterized protein n=1 Tax=Macroventuria anomochaeta TaxID=301207 RepID=A0ACB6RWT6_9PLEO|nr:uncharacterized protein BU25DRAFT_412024 [Macroventuria anomochaeta]KAF2626188.1 hypothetical protein BU25DRAFT_412024 [Macroventuria anomochaeta]
MGERYCCESAAEGQRCCSTETALFTLRAARLGLSSMEASSTINHATTGTPG